MTTPPREVTLEPCPFCDDCLAHIWSPPQGGYSVICGHGCGAEGPVMENEECAAGAWNTRTPEQPAQGMTGDAAAIRSYYFTVAEKGFQAKAPLWHELADETKQTYRDFVSRIGERKP